MAVMNLRRGLLRLWVVFSVAWIIAVGFDIYFRGVVVQPGEYTIGPPTEPGDIDVTLFGRMVVIGVSHLAWAFGPPVAVLIIGAALSWAIAGFRK
jgi:hypothetical protein